MVRLGDIEEEIADSHVLGEDNVSPGKSERVYVGGFGW